MLLRLGRIQASHPQVADLYEDGVKDSKEGPRLIWRQKPEQPAMAGSARGSLSATHESDSKRCYRSLEEVHAADGSGSGISHPEERAGHPSAVPSTGKAGEGPRAGGLSWLCAAGDAQASAEAEWFRVLADRSAETAARDPQCPTSYCRRSKGERSGLRRITKLDDEQQKILYQLQLQWPELLEPTQILKCSENSAIA